MTMMVILMTIIYDMSVVMSYLLKHIIWHASLILVVNNGDVSPTLLPTFCSTKQALLSNKLFWLFLQFTMAIVNDHHKELVHKIWPCNKSHTWLDGFAFEITLTSLPTTYIPLLKRQQRQHQQFCQPYDAATTPVNHCFKKARCQQQ